MDGSNHIGLSIALNVMGRVELAEYGFRSWMLQDAEEPYEVVLNLFNEDLPKFQKLSEGRNPNCKLIIKTYPKPEYFNISAANNLGIFHSTGRHVLFANSDVIYPSRIARRLVDDLERHSIAYFILTRANLTEEQSQALKAPNNYRRAGDFDGLDELAIASIWRADNGWVVRRDVAIAIGGFDPKILVMEDVDITDRLGHYLARKNIQHGILGSVDLRGYHLYHPTSELFDTNHEARQILTARRARLQKDPNSTEDVMPTNFNSHEVLAEEIRNTVRPAKLNRYRQDTGKKVVKRVKRAFDVLRGKRLE
ncbi:MAG: hypothetical protein ABSG31_18505 [Tepidisphaeraceae bacterium]|jgi:hypothetical protein